MQVESYHYRYQTVCFINSERVRSKVFLERGLPQHKVSSLSLRHNIITTPYRSTPCDSTRDQTQVLQNHSIMSVHSHHKLTSCV